MTADEDSLPTTSSGLASGLNARGFFVLTGSLDADEDSDLALWYVGVEGTFTGAWTFPASQVRDDPAVARRVLILAERRSIAGWEPDAASKVLHDVAAVAGVAVDDAWSSTSCALPTALAQTVAARSRYDEALDRYRKIRKHLAPLNWGTLLPDQLPDTRDELQSLVPVGPGPTDSPNAGAALAEARLVRWCIERWVETETVRGRRPYLLDEFGPGTALPPSWLSNVQDAYTRTLPL